MAKGKKRTHHYPLAGRHLLTLGGLSLLGLSGYELWIRLEDFWAWTSGIRHLSAVKGTPFLEDLAIIFEAPEMRQLGFKLLFLLITLIFAIVCVIRRKRAQGAWALILLDLAVAGAGLWLGLYSVRPSDWAQLLKLVPLAMILVGCVVNIIHRKKLKHRKTHRHSDESHDLEQWEQRSDHRAHAFENPAPGPGGVR